MSLQIDKQKDSLVLENALHQQKLDKIDQAYSSEPWWYDLRGFLILTFAYRSTLPKQIRLFSNNMGLKHLEVAIGTGTLFDLILKWRKLVGAHKSEVVGFDYAQRMLAGAQCRFKNEKNLTLELGDVTHLKYESNTFDTANIANAIHCFPDVMSGLKETHRVLKPNGTLAGNVLLFPKGKSLLDRLANKINQWGIQKGILYTPYTQLSIQHMLIDAGFEFVFEEVSGNCYNFVVRKKTI